ncbi:MAG: hypothetical protein AB7P04_03790 [Bacteriovoracia bacterium]
MKVLLRTLRKPPVLLAVVLASALAIVVGYFYRKNHQSNQPVRVEANELVLSDGQRIGGLGYELKLLNALSEKPPIYLLTSFECQECDALPELMVYSALTNQSEAMNYPGPISEFSPSSDLETVTIYESRFFHGACLTDVPNGVVQFHKTREPDGNWREGVTVIDFRLDGRIEGKLLETDLPSIETVLQAVREHKCHEVPTQDQVQL